MSSRAASMAAGFVLIAVAAAWFLTPLSGFILDQFPTYGPAPGRGGGASSGWMGWDLLKAGLDVANALIGCVGIYLALKPPRSSRQTGSS
jgi:hypothetical protein